MDSGAANRSLGASTSRKVTVRLQHHHAAAARRRLPRAGQALEQAAARAGRRAAAREAAAPRRSPPYQMKPARARGEGAGSPPRSTALSPMCQPGSGSSAGGGHHRRGRDISEIYAKYSTGGSSNSHANFRKAKHIFNKM